MARDRIVACIVTLLTVLLSGCSPKTVYVPQESVTERVDSVFVSRTAHDTIRETERVYEADMRYDSIVPILDSLNRVVGYDRYHFREVTKLNDREKKRLLAVIDSLSRQSADTVVRRVPYPVERKLTRWEQTKQDFGGMAIGGLIAVVVSAVIVWIVKLKRRV